MVLSEECERKEQEMPIKVRYDDDISALAQLALATGAKGLPQSRTPVVAGRGGGGGGRGGQPRVEDISAADLAVLKEDAAENAFERKMEGMQEELEFDLQRQQGMDELEEQQFERSWGLTEKKRMAEYNRGIAWLEGPESEEMEPEEKRALVQELRRQRLGIRQGIKLRDPQWDDNLQTDQGNPTEAGVPWKGQDGGTYAWKQNPTTGVKELDQITSPDKSLEYLTAKAEDERAKERRALMLKIMGMEYTPIIPGQERSFGEWGEGMLPSPKALVGIDIPAQEGAPRKYNPAEAAELADRLMGRTPDQLSPEDEQAELQRRTDAQEADDLVWEDALQNNRELIGYAKAIGTLTEADKKLPEWEGLARSFMRAVKRRKAANRPIPKEMTSAIEQALAILATAKQEQKQAKVK